MDIGEMYDQVSYFHRQLFLRAPKISLYQQATIFVGTYNVGTKKLPQSSLLKDWLTPALGAHICVIGLQEVDMSTKALMSGETARATPWIEAVSLALGQAYSITSKQMMGLLLILGVHSSIQNITTVEKYATCGVGLWGRGGNKGTVALTLRVADTRILFANLHLAADRGHGGARKRNQDLYRIATRLDMSPPPSGTTLFSRYQTESRPGIDSLDDYLLPDGSLNPQFTLKKSTTGDVLNPMFPKLFRGHDVVFLLGDLNYRLQTFSHPPHLILEDFLHDKTKGREIFLSIDQLSLQLNALHAPTYIPTYAIDDALFVDGNGKSAMDSIESDELAPDRSIDDSDCDDSESGPIDQAVPYYEEYLRTPVPICSYLYGFSEAPIHFDPTYKLLTMDKLEKKGVSESAPKLQPGMDLFSVLTDTKPDMDLDRYECDPEANKPRVPAYCDRILFRTISPDHQVVSHNYTSYPQLKLSDHRPVWFIGSLTIRSVDGEKLRVEEEAVRRNINIIDAELKPRYSLSTNSIDFGVVRYGTLHYQDVLLTNNHPVSACTLILDRSVTPPWIFLRPDFLVIPHKSAAYVRFHWLFNFYLIERRDAQEQFFTSIINTRFPSALNDPNLSLVSVENKRAFVLQRFIEAPWALHIRLVFVSGMKLGTSTRYNIIASEDIECAYQSALLHPLAQWMGLGNRTPKLDMIPPLISAARVYFQQTVIENTKGAFDITACQLMTSGAADILFANISVAGPQQIAAVVLSIRLGGTASELLQTYLNGLTLQGCTPFLSLISDGLEREAYMIYFYARAINGLEAFMSLPISSSVVNLRDDLQREFERLLSYTMKNVFGLSPLFQPVVLTPGTTQIDRAVHPTSVMHAIVDLLCSFPDSLIPESLYFRILAISHAPVQSQRKAAYGVVLTDTTYLVPSIVLELIKLFQLLLSQKVASIDVVIRTFVRLLARSGEPCGRDASELLFGSVLLTNQEED
ncbi:Inositol 5-phosphatase 4 [Giardia muris]|uniref:Inositol 5-phosphatase 4 n=1 Tax=Giardia muris TaxID=5742 RepID=A0A4Z1T6S9_GIAMU|nr:Inositol 5-phosphatase 4 [Giardia muris]|eukprot:TNJ28249.1 Inositol 5-phosphatase 4 [Giardia muris]